MGRPTNPIAVTRCVVKYSGAGARNGKYNSDMPKPTSKPCVSSCHTDVQKDASVNPIDTRRIPETVIAFAVSRRGNKLRRLDEHDPEDALQVPCSIRDITGFTTIPPAYVRP